jgi:hypothetical protein
MRLIAIYQKDGKGFLFLQLAALYPIIKRFGNRRLGAQAPDCTRQPGFPKNGIFWDGGTAQAEHQIDELTTFL